MFILFCLNCYELIDKIIVGKGKGTKEGLGTSSQLAYRERVTATLAVTKPQYLPHKQQGFHMGIQRANRKVRLSYKLSKHTLTGPLCSQSLKSYGEEAAGKSLGSWSKPFPPHNQNPHSCFLVQCWEIRPAGISAPRVRRVVLLPHCHLLPGVGIMSIVFIPLLCGNFLGHKFSLH